MKKSIDLLNQNDFQSVLNYFRSVDFKNKNIYANWLAQTYYFVSHSVRLSALGASKLSVDDPLCRRMIAHTLEENGHHLIAKKDIEALGEDLSSYPAFGITHAFYQSQYYKVLFEHPSHLLGQIILLEAIAVELGSWMYDLVRNEYGESASHFVRIHAKEDIEHVKKAIESIARLSEVEKQGVTNNFKQACENYTLILKLINEKTQVIYLKTAA